MGLIRRSWLRWFGKTVRVEGVLVFVDCLEISDALAMEIRGRAYEATEVEMLVKHLDKGDVVLELGGGIGLISTISAVRLKPLSVTVVEADRRMLDVIKATHRLNKTSVNVKWGAVSGENDTSDVEFFERSHFVLSSLSPNDSPWIRTYRVPRVSLTTLIREVNPTFLIIDIEGAEGGLFERITDLGRVSKILIEIHTQLLGDDSARLVISNLERLGFVLNNAKGLVHYFIR